MNSETNIDIDRHKPFTFDAKLTLSFSFRKTISYWSSPLPLFVGVCLELRFCVGVCSGERYPRLWDLSSRVNDQTLTYNVHKVKRDGTEEVILMGKRPR